MARPDLQVVVLAGGLGTRLAPLVGEGPKFLAPLRGRPFGAWVLDRIGRSGAAEVVLCLGHGAAAVAAAFPEGADPRGFEIVHVDEGAERRGTAGALRRALPRLAPTFVVTYGDSFLRFDYGGPLADLRAHPEAAGTMAVFRNEDRFGPSNAAVVGARVVRYDKAAVGAARAGLAFIDYGATALRREVVEALPDDRPIGLDAVQFELARVGRLRAYPVAERFFEIGSPASHAELEAWLEQNP